LEEFIKNSININEGIRVQEVHTCLLCNIEGILFYPNIRDRLFGAPGIWSFMRCPECGLVWLNPQPIFEDIEKLYEHYYTHNIANHSSKLVILRSLIRNSILATYLGYTELADDISQKMLGRILSLVGPIKEMVEFSVMSLNGQRKGRLLDIGCGSGAFLAKMRELGWNVTGVEFDRKTVKVAREHFGLNIYEGTLEEADFFENEFDVLTMNHVIEHFYDPITTLKEVYRILKPGGKLVIITPNIESLGARLFGRAWLHWDPPRHLYILSSFALGSCAKQVRLKIVKLFTISRSARKSWATSRLIRRNGILLGGSPQKLGFWLRLEGIAFQMLEYGLAMFKNAGEEIVLVATK